MRERIDCISMVFGLEMTWMIFLRSNDWKIVLNVEKGLRF